MLDLFQSGSLSELMHGNNIRSRFRHRLVCVLAQADLLARALRQGNPNNSKFHEPGILKLKSAADTAPCDMLRAGTPKDGDAVKSGFAANDRLQEKAGIITAQRQAMGKQSKELRSALVSSLLPVRAARRQVRLSSLRSRSFI